jgi:glycosyltransferase involved in cell wall biosynthesis
LKFSIVIPVYNEAPTAKILIERVLNSDTLGLEKEIIIVEGGSSDGTREIAREFEKFPGVRVIYEDRPSGKGSAVKKGLTLVTGDLILIQDGDLEYDVADYPRLLKPLIENRADVVYGSRVLRSPQSWQFRRFVGFERFYGFFVNFGGVLFTALFNLLYETHLSDGATMFKLFRRQDIQSIVLKSNGFDYDWEISAKLAKKNLRFEDVPVFYHARSRAEGKKIRFWRDGIRVFGAIIRYRFSN